MLQTRHALPLLSGNALKILAAVTMVIDHVGYLFFPGAMLFRIIGRLAFPIFAFMIAEGCHYTKNRLRYFLSVFCLAMICQSVYFIVDGSRQMNILVTFSLSILVIYGLQNLKNADCAEQKITAAAVFTAAVAAVWLLCRVLAVDYNFWGCMTPVLASVFRGGSKKWDRLSVHVLMLGLGLLLVALVNGGVQIYGLLALPLLLLYSGKRGKGKMKYFFYIFYPGHLALLYGIQMLLQLINK